jgi:photosystem II stability/assembly factor-like uncharacterized protein
VSVALVFLVTSIGVAAASRSGVVDAARHTPHDDVSAVALSPQFASDRTVFAIVRARLFRATDGGRRWERISYGLGSSALHQVALSSAFATDRTAFVAAYDAPYRSTDGGDTWERIGGAEAPVRLVSIHTSPTAQRAGMVVVVDEHGRLAHSSDAGTTWTSDPSAPLVAALAWRADDSTVSESVSASESASDTLFVAAIDGVCSTSSDGGATWTELGRLPDGVRAASITPDHDGHSWCIGTEKHGVWRAFGEPLEFECLDGDVSGGRVNGLVHVGTGDARTLLASTWRGGPRRFDAATGDFADREVPLETHVQAENIDRPSFGAFAAQGDDVFLATFCGLVHSNDGGRTWREFETLPRHLVMALDLVAQGPDEVAIALSTYGAGVSVSRDGGATWNTSSRGLHSARTMGVALSPQFAIDERITSGSYDVVLHSNDGGAHWKRIVVGDGARRGGTVANEDTQPTPVLIAYSPAFERDRTIFAALHPSGFVRSRDGGATFAHVGAGLANWPSALAVSPDFARDRTIFVATRDGLFVSRDAGGSFEALHSERAYRGCFVVLSPQYGEDGIVFAGGLEGLRVSRDGGRSFTAVDFVPGDAPERVAGIAVAPDFRESGEFLVQMRGGDLFVCRDESGAIRSDVSSVGRNGLEFCALASFVREVDPLVAYSPNYERDRTIWASDSLRLFKSTDGGRTFDGVARTTRVESGHLSIDGAWREVESAALGHVQRSTTVGSTAAVEFVGTGAAWIGSRGPGMGVGEVRVDGELVATVDLDAQVPERGVVVHAVRGLADGAHVYEITVVARAAPTESTDGATAGAAGETAQRTQPVKAVEVDAIDVELAP